MRESQLRSVQCLARKGPELLSERGARPARHTRGSAIHPVPEQREAEVCQVHANLVRTPGLEPHAHQGVVAEATLDAIVRDGPAAVLAHGHARALHAVAPDRLIDRAAGGQGPDAHREVLAPDRARAERCDERGVGLHRARHHHQARRVLVEPVHEPGARHLCKPRIERQERVLQGVASVARSRMHHQACGLVDDDERAILEQHLERQPLRAHPRIARQLRVHTHLLPAEHPVLAAQRAAVDFDRPRIDPGREPRARVLRQLARQCLVEAQACGLRRQLQHVCAELGGCLRGRKSSRWIRYTPRTHSAGCQREAPS